MNAPQSPAHANGFDCIRLLAAAVLFSHCYSLLGMPDREPFARFGNPSIGFVAVGVFFAVSGYLVTISWQRDPNVVRFMMRRVLRIVPALAFVIFLSFVVIGPLTTSLPLKDYFSNGAAWSYLFKIFIYPPQYGLPGVFGSNPFPNVVNGSLWSLRAEFSLYVALALAGFFGVLRYRWLGGAAALVCLCSYLWIAGFNGAPAMPARDQIIVFLSCASAFFIGMALAQNNVRFRWPVITAAALVLVTMIVFPSAAFKYAVVLTMSLLAILAAQNTRCDLRRFGDYSYGIYLWAFPVQQILVHFFPRISFLELLASAAILTFAMAVISWHLVEKKALAFKPRKSTAKAGS